MHLKHHLSVMFLVKENQLYSTITGFFLSLAMCFQIDVYFALFKVNSRGSHGALDQVSVSIIFSQFGV